MARFEPATGILCAVLLLAPSAMAQDAPPAAEAPPAPDPSPASSCSNCLVAPFSGSSTWHWQSVGGITNYVVISNYWTSTIPYGAVITSVQVRYQQFNYCTIQNQHNCAYTDFNVMQLQAQDTVHSGPRIVSTIGTANSSLSWSYPTVSAFNGLPLKGSSKWAGVQLLVPLSGHVTTDFQYSMEIVFTWETPAFTLTPGSNITMYLGASGATTDFSSSISDFPVWMDLSVSGLPAGVAATVSGTTMVNGSPQMQSGQSGRVLFDARTATMPQSGVITITGSTGSVSQSIVTGYTLQSLGCTNPSAPVGGTASCSVGQCTNGNMTCTSNGWSSCYVDYACDTSTEPPGSELVCRDPIGAQAQINQMNAGCPNGDWGGYDPIQLPLRSATTLPFTDFEVTVLRALGVTRAYSSSDVMVGNAAGIFGLGWHHNWETTLTCSNNGTSCTVATGAGGTRRFAAQPSTVVGVGAFSGEALVLYKRTEPTNLASGGNNLMVRRPNGEFILFQLDGSELHFVQPALCGSCMDASFNGSRRLTRDVDPAGPGMQLDFTVSGKILTVTDDLGNMLSLSPSATCPSRAGALSYRAGTDGVESVYVTYTYDTTCQVLKTVVPSNLTAAPGHSAQLRAYDYQSVPKAGLLTTIHNEFNDPVTVFGYDSSMGYATSLLDAQSSLSVTYSQPNQDKVVSAYGNDSFTVLSTRGAAGKAISVNTTTSFHGPADPTIAGSGVASLKIHGQVWDGQYLVCTEEETFAWARHFQRDVQERVTFLADYPTASPSTGATCASAPWTSKAPLRSWKFEYGIVKQIAQGVTLGLSVATMTSQGSVFAAQLAQAAGSGASPDAFQTSETLDYDPTSKMGDPTGYSCGTSGLPVGGLVCRKIVDGYTYDASGVPTRQRVGTFFSYDARGRLVRSMGPLYIVGQPPAGNVDPVEERTYWPDDDPDPMKRGRLHQIKRWASATQALTTSFATYDVFGPTQVQDPAGGTTIYTRAGGAGRVTRIDTPDGRHTSTRYYDGNLPRLLLLNGGSARRFTYDDKGRLHATEPLSGDPESSGSVTQGWIETRDHDVAGNTTLVTRADAQGTVRWKQIFDYYWDGTLRKDIHPEAGKGYALWLRNNWDGAPWVVSDEENNAIYYSGFDGLRRVQQFYFIAPEDVFTNHGGVATTHGNSGFVYEYEPGQDALSRVWNNRCQGCADQLVAGYAHDDFGRLLSVSAPPTMTAGPYTYAYDARRNVVKRSGGGSTISYQYDGVNRMTQLIATRTADGSSFEYDYEYDDPSAIGRLHSITEPGRTTTFTYDEVGRTRFEVVTETNVTTALTSEYRYDPDGDLSEVITPGGLDVKYERDPATKDVTKVSNVTSGTSYASGVTHLPAGPIGALTFAGGATLTQTFNLRYEPTWI
ncbi:MAG: RHS repeat protein, partial [Deltaproteobacteria bacterium]